MSETKRPLSGRQFDLSGHGYEATVASVGASLRALRHMGRDLVVPFEADEVRPAYRGATLAPWPNRVVGGRYRFGGEEHRLPLNEPERGHALHGLMGWAEFAAVETSTERAVLGATIEPQAGYPFRVEVRVEFALSETGLTQTVTATNLCQEAAPWGTGPHPYLSAGEGRVDDWTLVLGAAEVLAVTSDRLVPIAVEPIGDHPEFDFREPRRIGGTAIDHAFTALSRQRGMAVVGVTAADGSGVRIAWDDSCPWVQVHTADTGEADTDRIGLAVEPMTCPPDAFNSGTDLIVLSPGEARSAAWTISAIDA